MPETYQKKIISMQKMTDIKTAAMVFVDFFEPAIVQGLQVSAGAIDSIEMYKKIMYAMLEAQAQTIRPQILELIPQIPSLSMQDAGVIWQTFAQIVVKKNIPQKFL